jgi:hypothetical protein
MMCFDLIFTGTRPKKWKEIDEFDSWKASILMDRKHYHRLEEFSKVCFQYNSLFHRRQPEEYFVAVNLPQLAKPLKSQTSFTTFYSIYYMQFKISPFFETLLLFELITDSKNR